MSKLNEKQLKLAERLSEKDFFNDTDAGNAQLLIGILLSERKALIEERDSWKSRAEQHGCDTENGDPDCQ